MIGGYLGATFAMQRTKTSARRHRVTALLGHAVVLGLVIDLIAGPILGGYPDIGRNFWLLWPIFAFIAFAVALVAATLQTLIGPMGTLLTVILIVFIGNPSTGGGNGVAFLPPFWQALGVVLPPRNGLYLIRNTLSLPNAPTGTASACCPSARPGSVSIDGLANRRMRARMSGGVGGAGRPRPAPPRSRLPLTWGFGAYEKEGRQLIPA